MNPPEKPKGIPEAPPQAGAAARINLFLDALKTRMGQDEITREQFIRSEVREIGSLTTILADAALVLSHRYHGALAAIASGVAVRIIAQEEGDKLSSLKPLVDDPALRDHARKRAQEGERALKKALAAITTRE